MRRIATLSLLVLAATSWLAAGPGGLTVRELLHCRSGAMPMSHHASTPSDGPCFCAQMSGGFDVVVSPAVPTPLPPEAVILPPAAELSRLSLFPLPSSPSFAPTPPPPDHRG